MWFYPQKFNIAQLDLISKTTTYEKILFDAVADVLLIDATLKLVNLKMCKTISVFYENVENTTCWFLKID